MTRILRFAIGQPGGGPASRYWIISATSATANAILTRDGAGGWFHLTYHGGKSAHVKVLYQGREHTRPLKALPELVPGFRRLIQVRVPLAAARYPSPPAPAGIVLMPSPTDPEQWAIFEVILEHPRASRESWPGRNTGTNLVGRVELADGSRFCVIHREATGASGSWTASGVTDDEKRAIREAAERGQLAALIFGEEDDGTLWVLDAPAP